MGNISAFFILLVIVILIVQNLTISSAGKENGPSRFRYCICSLLLVLQDIRIYSNSVPCSNECSLVYVPSLRPLSFFFFLGHCYAHLCVVNSNFFASCINQINKDMIRILFSLDLLYQCLLWLVGFMISVCVCVFFS